MVKAEYSFKQGVWTSMLPICLKLDPAQRRKLVLMLRIYEPIEVEDVWRKKWLKERKV